MKRFLILSALICLMLCGCDAEPVPTQATVPTEILQTESTEPAGCYLPDSELERQTKGAVRTYRMEKENTYAIKPMGEDVLVFSGIDNTVLTLLSGENLFNKAQTELNCWIVPDDPAFTVSDKWITYFDEAKGQIVYLDNALKEANRIAVPEEITGVPTLSPDQRKIYYCTDSAVRVLDQDSQIDRMLKEITSPNLRIDGMLLDGTVLQFSISGDGVDWTSLYISPETGEILWEQLTDLTLTTGTDAYYGHCLEGHMDVYFYGKPGEDPRMIQPESYTDPVWFVEERHGAVSAAETGESVTLSYYDLDSGLRTSALTLKEMYHPRYVEPAPGEGQIYLLFCWEEPYLYRWDTCAMATNDTQVHTSPRYTLANPDGEGLARCANLAQELSDKYNVEILLNTDATAVQPWDYIMIPEYHVPVIEEMLTQLDESLSVFPEGFLTTMAEGTAGKKVKICLVRELKGSYESGSLVNASGVQFWDGENAYVALTMDGNFRYNVYHELFHVIDTRVLSECASYDKWNELNPKGFRYDNDYIANQERDGSAYLEESSRSFIDTYSMSFPKEDRARIMEYACNEGNKEFFATVTMQKKLKQLCMGIRKAFGLQKSTEVYLWEQYLDTPIAYQPKN